MKGDGIPLTPSLWPSISRKAFFHEALALVSSELIDQLFHAREKLLLGARVVGEA